MNTHWVILYDPISSKNIAAIGYEQENEIIRCESSREELKTALESMAVNHNEITTQKISGMTIMTKSKTRDASLILDEVIKPYLNPLTVGGRGVLRDTKMDDAMKWLRPYVKGSMFSEEKKS